MDLRGQKLQGLRRRMGAWRSRLRAATGAYAVDFPNRSDGSFDVVIKWRTRQGELGHYARTFDEGTVFPPGGAVPMHKPCDYVRQIIKAVLDLRGVT